MRIPGNKVLLSSKGNYIQYPEINNHGNEYKEECIHMYTWLTSPYSRNEQNIVNQLYFNWKKKKKKNSRAPRSSCQRKQILGGWRKALEWHRAPAVSAPWRLGMRVEQGPPCKWIWGRRGSGWRHLQEQSPPNWGFHSKATTPEPQSQQQQPQGLPWWAEDAST